MKDYTELGLEAIDQAKSLTIDDQQDYEVAQAMGKAFSNIIKEIKEYFKPMKADAKKSHQNIVDAEKDSLNDPQKATAILKASMLTYENKLEALRRAEEAKLREELAARQKEEREKAEEDGLEIEPPEIIPEDIVVAPTIQKQGQTRVTQEVVVTNVDAFVTWLGNSNYPAQDYVTINKTACKSLAKEGVPGIKLQEKRIKVF